MKSPLASRLRLPSIRFAAGLTALCVAGLPAVADEARDAAIQHFSQAEQAPPG